MIITECIVANPYPWRGSDSLNPLLCDAQDKYRHVSQVADVVHSYKGTKILHSFLPAGAGRAIPSPAMRASLREHLPLYRWKWISAILPKAAAPGHPAGLRWNRGELRRPGCHPEDVRRGVRQAPSLHPGVYGKERRRPLHVAYGEAPRELTIKEIEQIEGFMVEQAVALYGWL